MRPNWPPPKMPTFSIKRRYGVLKKFSEMKNKKAVRLRTAFSKHHILFLTGRNGCVQMLFNLFYKVAFGLSTNELIHDLSTTDKKDRRYRRNAIIHADLRIVVHIYFTDVNLSVVLFRQFFDNRTDRAAGATPLCPKVYN